MKYLRFLDIVSVSPRLKIRGEGKYITKLGICFGFLTIISILTLSIILFSEVVNHEKINILYNIYTNSDPTIDFRKSQIVLLITDAFGNEFENDDRLFDITAKFWNITFPIINDTMMPAKANILDVPMRRCKNKTFEYFNSYYQSMNSAYNSLLCPEFGDKNISLVRKYGNKFGYTMLNFYFNKCTNNTQIEYSVGKNNRTCFPQGVIEKKLSQIYISLLRIENDINTKDFTNPINTLSKIDLLPLSITIFKNYNIDINYVKLISDNGMLFENNQEYTTFRTERIYENVDLRGDNTIYPGTFSQVNFRGSGNSEIFNRSYYKIQSALANFGGIFQIVTIIGRVLIFFWSKNNMNEYLIQSILEAGEFMKLRELNESYSFEDLQEKINFYNKNYNSNSTNSNWKSNKDLINPNSNLQPPNCEIHGILNFEKHEREKLKRKPILQDNNRGLNFFKNQDCNLGLNNTKKISGIKANTKDNYIRSSHDKKIKSDIEDAKDNHEVFFEFDNNQDKKIIGKIHGDEIAKQSNNIVNEVNISHVPLNITNHFHTLNKLGDLMDKKPDYKQE